MNYQQQVNRTIDMIKAAPNRPYSLQDLADEAFLSPYHFHRIFKTVTGETPGDFISRQRLISSCHPLLHSDESITNIAMNFGFSSSANYSKAFKKKIGVSPRLFRRQTYRMIQDENPIPINTYEDLPTPRYKVEYEEPLPLLYYRYYGKLGPSLGLHWKKFKRTLKNLQVLTSGTQQFALVYEDFQILDPQRTIYDACISLPKDFINETPFSVTKTAGCKYLKSVYTDTPRHLHQFYQRIFDKIILPNDIQFADAPMVQKILTPPKGGKMNIEVWIPVE